MGGEVCEGWEPSYGGTGDADAACECVSVSQGEREEGK